METIPAGQPQGAQSVQPRPPRPLLSYRQQQFLSLRATGKTNRKIAQECFVIEQTVHKTLEAARERLGAKNTLHAVVLAIALEILALDSDGVVTVPESSNHLYYNSGGLTLGHRNAA
jgi:DNA-binding NarL/FixJ family response regulator